MPSPSLVPVCISLAHTVKQIWPLSSITLCDYYVNQANPTPCPDPKTTPLLPAVAVQGLAGSLDLRSTVILPAAPSDNLSHQLELGAENPLAKLFK